MECEIVDVAGNSDIAVEKMNGREGARKKQKRKRASAAAEISGTEEKEARICCLREELEALFKYYREVMAENADLEAAKRCRSGGVNTVVAAMLEERDLPLSKLVDEIFNASKAVCDGLTAAAVKSAVLLVGQRVLYGVPNADADVLEDQSDSCLWCWEARDIKLMPQSVRGVLNIRRSCRKRIHERITAISEMITALQMSENDPNYKPNLKTASSKLGKAISEASIRLLIAGLMQKNGSDLAEKEAKKEEKLLIKQMDRDKRQAEKERKRLEQEILKEKLQSEKEQKRLQEEAEKDEKRREKEASEKRKQLKKQQEEAEKDQRRREKEEAEIKKRLAIQKQASIMERFVKRSKTSPLQTEQSSTEAPIIDTSSKRSENVPEAVTQLMDSALLSNDNFNVDEICRLHLSSWRRLGHSIRSNGKQHWGIRQKPKTELFKKLKLTNRPLVLVIDESEEEKLADEFVGCVSDDGSCQTNASCSLPDVKKCIRGKQLLQFDKSHRPAFYGIWPNKSRVVGPRHPFRKDPDLDYDIDSDEEWEEEDPGESLSDCDKNDEDESLKEEESKADEGDDSEDGFFVPDGYLSENEGVQIDSMDTDAAVESKSSPGLESEEFCTLLRQQKYLNNLTEHALRKNQPLIIKNLMHDKASLLLAEDLVGTPKLERNCLQALSMCLFPGSSVIEISLDSIEDIDQEEVCPPRAKDSATPSSAAISFPEADLRALVSGIRSSSQRINKLAECLQQKFPSFSKSQLRNKVREISDFVDNRWQVKKEVLEKLGLSPSPEKSSERTKSIAAFFSKRCLPPAGERLNLNPK